MSEELLVRHCAPTLAGLKTANLFACPFSDGDALRRCLCCWNRRLTKKGLRILPLRFEGRRALIYVYRPARLACDLRQGAACRLLEERGYPVGGSSERCIIRLMERLRGGDRFPDEIGLFLGYPPEDVDGFIRCRAQGAKCVGTWKVYGDVDAAKKKFALYQKCARLYQKAYGRHQTLDRLIVSRS